MDAESLAQVEQIVTSVVGNAITGLRQDLTSAVADLRREIADSREEGKRHTGVLFEDAMHKLELVVEGMQFLRQADADIRAELAYESRETRALLRLSYQQLDHRVRTLEQRFGPPG
jgi:hypothetical protein